ncbi:uncharacterized protein BXZ73DRAFT_40643 [Epithele typhae]|uniref:uncharacterized protein n=1 Tax=Epithele typhae TaxID=378194 RepID=UPI002007ED39|nr:uncharacterized protein BXZ73DRAFT_40643 [Epithele typhae]KAH9943224.1 hypothetical protein BXZ73DRAFT_40643 [Epithele typhae]
MEDGQEAYILLLLSDSNLPTGSFVASAGLESYVTHGFFSNLAPAEAISSTSTSTSPPDKMDYTVNFLRDSLSTYAHSALPFVTDAHSVTERYLGRASAPLSAQDNASRLESTIAQILELDELYETMTLNHIARRASKSQGVALLTLFSKGFSKPTLPRHFESSSDGTTDTARDSSATALMDRLKLLVRREDTHGHLPVCWGILTASLGLSTERSQHLHLFLQARSLLSSSVRLNTIGPYAAQQVLLHAVRPLVDAEVARAKGLYTGLLPQADQQGEDEDTVRGPAMTWPLGEILAARHDLQHSRIFNS